MELKVNICMLISRIQYDPKMCIVPQIGIASYISNFGHDVTWILSSEEIKEVQETAFDDARVFVVPCKYREGLLRPITRILYAFRRMNFVFNNFKQEKYNMIFVRDEVFDGLLALYLKRRYKIPFVFEMSNPIEQEYEVLKFYSKRNYFLNFIMGVYAHLVIYTLQKADLVLPTTRWMEDDFAEKGIKRSKMMAYPNGINLNRFINANGDGIRQKYELQKSKVVIYVGSMARIRHLDVLIHAFSKVKKVKGDAKLLMVGDGSDRANLEKLAGELGIGGDVVFTGQVNFNEIPNFIALADIGISPVPPLDFYKLSSPIKSFEYMTLGKPVVANEEIPEQKEVIEGSGGGILVKFEAESFADGIVELLDNHDGAKEMGRKGREWVVKNRSYERMSQKLEKRYFDLLR